MKSCCHILIRTRQIGHTKIIWSVCGRVGQEELRSSRPIVHRGTIECCVPILHSGIPIQFIVCGAGVGGGGDPIPRVVTCRIELANGGQSEDFAPVWEVVIVRHVGGGIRKRPCSTEIRLRRDGEIIRRRCRCPGGKRDCGCGCRCRCGGYRTDRVGIDA